MYLRSKNKLTWSKTSGPTLQNPGNFSSPWGFKIGADFSLSVMGSESVVHSDKDFRVRLFGGSV